MINGKDSMDRLLFVMPSYGIALATAKKFIAEYGLDAVERFSKRPCRKER